MSTKIRQSSLDPSVVTGLTELAAGRADADFVLVYDASSGSLKKIQASNLGFLPPSVTSISPTNVLTGDGTGNHTIVITGKGFLADATAKLTTNGGTDIAFDSVTRNSSTQITGVVAKSKANLTSANEPFDVSVTTAGSLTATKTDALTIDASPVFVTGAGSLGSVAESAAGSFKVNATDPESAGNVTFELQSGSLPTNFTLVNTAAEGGTAIIAGTHPVLAANTTYNFVLRAVDAASNTSSRSFAITITNNPVSTSFTSSGTFAVPSGTTLIDVMVVAGGGGGGRDGGGGGGAGGLIYFPNYPVTPAGTMTVTVGSGGQGGKNPSLGSSPVNTGNDGQDSVFGAPGDPGKHPTGDVLTAKGGGGGGGGPASQSGSLAGRQGGSGGGGNGHGSYGTIGTGSAQGGGGQQGTQPGDSGAYGFGGNGGQGYFTQQTPQNHLSGGGGGGAGANGQNGGPNHPTAGVGGVGKAYTIGDGTTSVFYAGGGAGATGVGPGAGTRSQGGGGTCNSTPGTVAGVANRGGGGGAESPDGSAVGGKGIVIVRA